MSFTHDAIGNPTPPHTDRLKLVHLPLPLPTHPIVANGKLEFD